MAALLLDQLQRVRVAGVDRAPRSRGEWHTGDIWVERAVALPDTAELGTSLGAPVEKGYGRHRSGVVPASDPVDTCVVGAISKDRLIRYANEL
jgi:hypothetical protein